MRLLLLAPDTMLGPVLKICLQNYGYDCITLSHDKTNSLHYNPEQNVYQIENIVKDTHPDIVVNCLAALIEESEHNHPKAVLLNSFLPHFLNSLSLKYHFKLIHRSTDCVFSGLNGSYTELSFPDATNFYGKSKALGEINNNSALTLRASIIGPDTNPDGESLFPWFMRQTSPIEGYSEVYWTGITSIDFARIIDLGIKNNLSGLFNVSNGKKIAKSDLLRIFAKYYRPDVFIKDNPTKKSDKSLIQNSIFDFEIPSYDKMISNMYEWTSGHPELYPFLQERNQ